MKLPISARDWHFLVALFSKNQLYMKIDNNFITYTTSSDKLS